MNCFHLTQELILLRGSSKLLDLTLEDGQSTGEKILMEQEDLNQYIEELLEKHFSIQAVIERLEDKKYWEVLSDLLETEPLKTSVEKNSANFYSLIKLIFFPLPIAGYDEGSVREFVDTIISNPRVYRNSCNSLFDKIENDDRRSNFDLVFDAIRVGLINRLNRLGSKVQIPSGVLKKSFDYLGMKMNGGELEVDKAGAHFGYKMERGILRAEVAGKAAGSGMSGGEIFVNFCDEMAGYMMTGGRIYIKSVANTRLGVLSGGGAIFASYVNGEFGNHSIMTNFVIEDAHRLPDSKDGGVVVINEVGIEAHKTIFRGYTALVNHFKDSNFNLDATARRYVKGKVFGYSDEMDSYFEYDEGEKIVYPKTDAELDAWKAQKGGLCVVEDISTFKKLVTEGMEDGIMVIRTANLSDNIGIGMKGGVIIFDHPDLTLESAREKVIHDSYGDSVILIRVQDPEEMSKTKLIEVKK